MTFVSLNNRNNYKSCDIYKGDFSCGLRYISETKHYEKIRWNEKIIQLKIQNH